MAEDPVERLIALEALRKGMDPNYALAVARHESRMNPAAVGDRGRSLGLFQLQPGAAIDAGIDPRLRQDIVPNIEGGVAYLHQSLNRAGGNPALALEMYNKGPALHGRGDPQYVQHVDAQYRQVSEERGRAAMEERLRAIQQRRQQATTPPAVPSPAPSPGGVPQAEPVAPPTLPSDLVVPIEKPSTPAPASAGGGALAWLPGFEFMQGLPQEAQEKVAQAIPQAIHQVAPTAINVGASLAGSALGGATGTALAGPAGTAPGAMLGDVALSAAARWLNVKLGLEAPGVVGDVTAVGMPVVGRAVGAGLKALGRHLPGASRVGHELAADLLEELPEQYLPQTTSQALFRQAAQQRTTIPLPTLARTAQAILTHEGTMEPAFRLTPLQKRAQSLVNLLATHQGSLPMQTMDSYRQRLGLMLEQANAENWPYVKGLRELYGALMTDLEQAAAQGTGAQVLRDAIAAARKEFALEDLTNLWAPGKGITNVDGTTLQVNGRRILNQFDKLLHEDARFVGSFMPEELPEIRATLRDVARLTAQSPTAKGLLAGETSWLRHLGAIGAAYHGNIPLALGLEAAPYVIAAALTTAPGRAAVRRAFQEGGGRLTPAGLALISSVIRGPAAPVPGQEVPLSETEMQHLQPPGSR